MATTLFIYLLCIGCWLGGMVFFTVFAAPALFATLPVRDAGRVVSTIFPRYYLLGYITGVISTMLAIYFVFSRTPRPWWSLSAVALAIALGLTLYAGAVVRPRIETVRGVSTEPTPDPARKAEFDQLHHLSVMLNGGAMILNLLALLTTAVALTPRG
jgi:hypothetical protein